MHGSEPLYRGRVVRPAPRLSRFLRFVLDFLPPLKNYLTYLEAECHELNANFVNLERLNGDLNDEFTSRINYLTSRIADLDEALADSRAYSIDLEAEVYNLENQLEICQSRLDVLDPKPVVTLIVPSGLTEDDIPF